MTVLEEIALRQSARVALLGIGIVAAAVYAAVFCYRGPSAAKTGVKAIPLLAFAGAGAATFAQPLILVALVASAVGDIALSRPGARAFLIGLVGFAVAHVFYILQFWALSDGGAAGMPAVGLVAAIVVFALSTEVWLAPYTGAMRWPVRGYVVLISLMGLTAFGLGGYPLAVIGAVAFMASDTILSLQLFRMPERSRWQVPASVCLWVLYAGGQFAILAGAGWQMPLFQIG